MSKILQVSVLLGLLFCLTAGQHALMGYTTFNTISDKTSTCFVVINGSLSPIFPNGGTQGPPTYILDQEFASGANQPPTTPPTGCNYHHWFPASFFNGDSFDPNNAFALYLNNTSGDHMIQSWIQESTVQLFNGTACVSLPQTDNAALQQYLCHIMYDQTPVYMVAFGSGSGANFTFNNSGSNNSMWFVDGAEESLVTGANGNTVIQNTTFPTIVGNLYNACNGTNTTISSLSNEVMVSTSVDLHANLGGNMWLAWALIRQNGSLASGSTSANYNTVSFSSNTPLFASAPSSSGCWDMGIKYSALLSNISYCTNGCSVTFVLMDANMRIFALETNGLFTAAVDSNPSGSSGSNSTSSGNSTSSNSTNTNSTSGSNSTNTNGTSTNGTSTSGGNHGAAANSAISLGFNMLILLISLVYLAKL